jgi:hypothetical protein
MRSDTAARKCYLKSIMCHELFFPRAISLRHDRVVYSLPINSPANLKIDCFLAA